MAAATAQICPVVGTTTTVLPPNHPEYDASKPVCLALSPVHSPRAPSTMPSHQPLRDTN